MSSRDNTHAAAAVVATAAITAIGFALAGPIGPAVIGPSIIGAVGVNLGSSLVQSGSQQFKERWLSSGDGVLNHDIQRAVARALTKALGQLETDYFATQQANALEPHQKASVRALFKDLKGRDFLAPVRQAAEQPAENARIKALLLAPQTDAETQFWAQLAGPGLLQMYGFRDFLHQNLFSAVQFWFGEELKTDSKECNKAWRAYQRLLLESTRAEIAAMHAGQEQMIEELRKLDTLQEILDELRKTPDTRVADEPFEQPFKEAIAQIGADMKTLLATTERIDKTTQLTYEAVRDHGSKLNILVERSAAPTTPERVFNVPRQNTRFTGREHELQRLHEQLQHTGHATLSGLGGIGKTQTAIEYAHTHRENYRYAFWTRADTPAALATGFNEIARLLNLPEKDAQEQDVTTAAVQRWLQINEGWLLVVDNADDLTLAQQFLPMGGHGHVLMTTRAPATGGLSDAVKLPKLTPEQGALLLLRRARRSANNALLETASTEDRDGAIALSKEVDGLPLALDQAGAYIEEMQCLPADYLALYRAEGKKLRDTRGELGERDHASVTVTFSLAFETVEKANPAAADLLRLCAFCAPDAIPEELVRPKTDISDLEWNAAIRAGGRLSLLTRDPNNKTISVHRLVQEVIRDGMDEETQRLWVERAVLALNDAFPFVVFANWHVCERLIPHALSGAKNAEQFKIENDQCARLLNQTAFYLGERARYIEAEPLFERALAIREDVRGAEHPDTASSLNNLAELYRAQGKLDAAAPLFERALAICEDVLGAEHPDTASSLNNLAALYYAQGKLDAAAPLFERALAIREDVRGAEHPDTATSLNNLAELYRVQGKLDAAAPLFERALAIRANALGAEHPDTASSLNNLALLYYAQGKLDAAEPLFERALAIRENVLGAEHPDTANSLNNLAGLYHAQGKLDAAAPLFERALAICEDVLGAEHPHTATGLNNLALLYCAQGKLDAAAPLFERALAIREDVLGAEHPHTATSLNNLAGLYDAQGKLDAAEPLYERALAISERALGTKHPTTTTIRENLADLRSSLS